MPSPAETSDIYQRPAELLSRLIQFDTTNPPGNEAEGMAYIRGLLEGAGIPVQFVARTPERPNLIARLRGRGAAAPLLLYGHLDVVTTEGQTWTHPPFSGAIVDGEVWGRGAIDMKGGIAMMIAALLRARAEGFTPTGDVILAVLADEESWGDYGARYLVEEHPELFAGVRYALGEFGGFTFYLGPRRFYPIMVAEKQGCAVTATVRGPGGHGSMVMRGGTMARLGTLLQRLDMHRLPPHITPATRLMIETAAGALPNPIGAILTQLLDPARTDAVLDMLGPQGATFDPLLHNTVNATIVRGGEKANVIPSEVTVALDCRLLPGFTPDVALAELRALAGDVADFAAGRADLVPAAAPDMGLFATLGDILREADPEGVPMPYMLPAVTDGRHLARLGIQTYGYLPLLLSAGWDFMSLVHAADERVPVAALEFGAQAMYRAVQRFGEAVQRFGEAG